MKVLVTGAAGFIGMHSCKRLLERGHEVLGIDNLNDYYDPALKRARLEQLRPYPKFAFQKLDVAYENAMSALFAASPFACADAAGRRAGDLRIDRPAARRDRLCARDAGGGGRRALHCLVQDVLETLGV